MQRWNQLLQDVQTFIGLYYLSDIVIIYLFVYYITQKLKPITERNEHKLKNIHFIHY